MIEQPNRREFISRLGIASAAFAGAGVLPADLAALEHYSAVTETWDMSWLDRLKGVAYRAVVDANVVEDGYAFDLAGGLLDTLHEVHGTSDDQARIVIVARRLGTPLVFGDALWERFPLGEDTKLNDSATKAPYRRNPFYRPRPGASPESAATRIETLLKRGLTLLVCNVAANNWSHSLAAKTNRPVEEVKKEVFGNFVPGTIVVPSGVFALMRAQNAGCAYMRGQ